MSETAYCCKCKAKRDVKNAKEVVMKNGRPAMSAECATCSCRVYSIRSTKTAAKPAAKPAAKAVATAKPAVAKKK